MPRKGLFDRITGNAFTSITGQEAAQIELSNLLNTRCGAIPANPDYGLPDLADLLSNLPLSAPQVTHVIETQITRFVPMLKKVRVSPSKLERGGSTLQFWIEAELRDQNNSLPFHMITQIAQSGRIKLLT